MFNIDRGLYTYKYIGDNLVKVIIANKDYSDIDTYDNVISIVNQMKDEETEVVLSSFILLCKKLDRSKFFCVFKKVLTLLFSPKNNLK